MNFLNTPLRILTFLGAIIAAGSLFGANIYSPSLEWRTIETAHFRIHFHQGVKEIALKTAVIAERTHEKLVPLAGWTPAAKTEVVVVDNTDWSNGSATPFPVNRIEIYASAPGPDSVLHNSSDWIETVFTHEYTHILNLDMITGCISLSRVFPGRIFFPGIFQPMWLIEGNAVFNESMDGKHGRNNSSYADMIIRTEVYSDRFKDMSKAAVFPREWPAGRVPYLYGGRFLEFLDRKYGKGKSAQIFEANSDNLIPYMLCWNSREVFRKRFPTLWDEWENDIFRSNREIIDRIKTDGLSAETVISPESTMAIMPIAGPDGRVYYAEQSQRSYTKLVSVNTDGSGWKEHCRLYAPLCLSPAPDGSVFVADAAVYKNFSIFGEAYSFSGDYNRLTGGKRISHLDTSPDGSRVLYITSSAGKYSLCESTADFTDTTYIVKDSSIQLSFCRYSPDGKRAVLSYRRGRPEASIALIDLTDKTAQSLKAPFSCIHPAFHPDGRRILFSADSNGVYNLHEYNPDTGTISRITNLIGGAFHPGVIDSGGAVVYSSYHPDGFSLAVSPYPGKVYSSIKAESRPLAGDYFGESTSSPELEHITDRPYSPFPSALPQFALPSFGIDAVEVYPGGYDSFLSFSTYAYDVLYRHSYGLAGAYYFEQRRSLVNMYYTYSGLYPNLTGGFADSTLIAGEDRFPWSEPETDSAVSRKRYRMAYTSMSLPFRNIDWDSSISLSYFYNKKYTDRYYQDTQTTIMANESFVQCSFSYLDDEAYIYSISPEDGKRFLLFGNIYNRTISSDNNFGKAAGEYYEYLPGFALNHVVTLNIRGGGFFSRPAGEDGFYLGKYASGAVVGPSAIEDVFGIRGYPASAEMTGDYIAAGFLEYRFPLIQMDLASGNFPLMFRDLWIKLFAESGNVWSSRLDFSETKVSAGVQLYANLTLGYNVDSFGYIGYARGLQSGGENQVFFGFGINLMGYAASDRKTLDYFL